jgi:hypothetical protein
VSITSRFQKLRVDSVRTISHNLGYGVGDDMDSLLMKYAKD